MVIILHYTLAASNSEVVKNIFALFRIVHTKYHYNILNHSFYEYVIPFLDFVYHSLSFCLFEVLQISSCLQAHVFQFQYSL